MSSTKIVDVKLIGEELMLAHRQLPLVIDDNKVMILQLSDSCEYCNENKNELEQRKGRHLMDDHHNHAEICYTSNSNTKKGKQPPENSHSNRIKRKQWSEEYFLKQYNKLSQEEALEAIQIPSKTIFACLSQVVGCVGCRRSVERLYNQLKDSDHPAMDPIVINSSGVLSVFMDYSLKPKVLNNLFSNHKTPLNEMLDLIPKSKKSGRCILHSMDTVRFRAGSQFCFDLWKSLSGECKKTISLINIEQLLTTLDNYLRKHRFCHECKNKVHRAYNILVGTVTIDPNKEKGYVASLYTGITKIDGFINVSPTSEVISNLLSRAEPELQGRDSLFLSRERHAKTLEIAQEEVLTCLGLFLHERLQKIFCRMREEEQAYDILFHIGLDAIRRNFELAVEEKQGYSKFEKFCEELQQEELIIKAKKEKKTRKKQKAKKKNNEETKENTFVEETLSCEECDTNRTTSPIKQQREATEPSEGKWCVVGGSSAAKKLSRDRLARSCSEGKESHAIAPLECAISIDSLVSRCSQCSRDGGYCSAQCSSRDSSEAACGEGLCSHSSDDVDSKRSRECSIENDRLSPPKQIYAPSLTEMLDDSSCEVDEIPEAEVLAWHARLGAVKQKRAELRQTLRQRFQQLCHRRSLTALNSNLSCPDEGNRCLRYYNTPAQTNAVP